MSQNNDTLIYSVRQELDKLCVSPMFTSAPRMQQLLRFLVDKVLSGNQNQIKAYTIGVEIFGRDQDFNPQSDPVVRVEMRRLRSKLDDPFAKKLLHTVRGMGYVLEDREP